MKQKFLNLLKKLFMISEVDDDSIGYALGFFLTTPLFISSFGIFDVQPGWESRTFMVFGAVLALLSICVTTMIIEFLNIIFYGILRGLHVPKEELINLASSFKEHKWDYFIGKIKL